MARARLVRWSQRLLMVVATFGLVYLFLVMIQPYRFAMTLAEKRGRVVDAQTGEGLPDVVVIANYELESATPVQIGSGCVHQKIVRTDANGYYVVPDASRDIDTAKRLLWRMLPGFSESYGWLLLYYKDGYLEKEEMERMVDLIEGQPVPSVARVAPYEKEGAIYVVPPVVLQQVDESWPGVMADAYIAKTGALAARAVCFLPEERNSEEFKRLREDMKVSVRSLICNLPPDKVLAEQALRFSFTDCAASIGMRRIMERKEEGSTLSVGDMCEAYRYVPSEYECQGLKLKRPPLNVVPKLTPVPKQSVD